MTFINVNFDSELQPCSFSQCTLSIKEHKLATVNFLSLYALSPGFLQADLRREIKSSACKYSLEKHDHLSVVHKTDNG